MHWWARAEKTRRASGAACFGVILLIPIGIASAAKWAYAPGGKGKNSQERQNDCPDRTRNPCRRLLLGRAGFVAALSRRDLHPGRLHRRRCPERDLPQPWKPRRSD